MKIVYVAHPVSGDVAGNVQKIKSIIVRISSEEVYAIAPYLAALEFLDDSDPEERYLGIEYNRTYFERRFVDEVWVFGDRISEGVKAEIELASKHGIPVFFKS